MTDFCPEENSGGTLNVGQRALENSRRYGVNAWLRSAFDLICSMDQIEHGKREQNDGNDQPSHEQ
jgi:hypothetical protein